MPSVAIELPKYLGLTQRMRDLIHHPHMKIYNLLAIAMVLANLFIANQTNEALSHPDLILLGVIVNFTIAIVIRQQRVINLLFKIATSLPQSAPLHLRWAAGKVYHFGGIHVGCFLSGFLWLLAFALFQMEEPTKTPIPLALTVFQLAILIPMIILSLPNIRAKYHDLFEVIARFGNWILLLSFWAQFIFLNLESALIDIITSPFFFTIITGSIATILPWLQLKKVPVKLTRPSNHVVLAEFEHATPFAGSSTDLSMSPLFEWHHFANVPSPNKQGFRLTISRAGDWTGDFIDKLPDEVWVKGVETAGVGNVELLFKKVLWVATGSGIGPCLPHLLSQKVPAHLLWSTRSPEITYGKELIDEIRGVQPNAVIWNTSNQGKPDLFSLSYEEFKKSGAEAVICISNKKTTFELNYEFERRGIPAFGAIWDS